jgi:hypothetical protein
MYFVREEKSYASCAMRFALFFLFGIVKEVKIQHGQLKYGLPGVLSQIAAKRKALSAQLVCRAT